MAEFNVTPQAAQPVNYTGASQGINSSANTALGTLFQGLAEAGNAGVQEADRFTQETIRDDIFAESDAIMDEFGVGDATEFQADADSPTPRPAQLQASGENLSRLQTAYERGALKESHYWARMNSMVRQLRQRYPGYRGEIDTMVSGIVGGRPANQLRNALFNEWAATTAETPLAKMEDWAVKNGRLPADYYDRQNSQNPYSQTELSSYIATKTRQDAETADIRAQIALGVDQGNVNTANTEKAWNSESANFVTQLLSDAGGTVGTSYQVIQERIRDAQDQATLGAPIDTTHLMTALQQLEGDVMLALNQKFNESWDGDAKHSYVANLSATQKDAGIAAAMQPIAILKAALTSENPMGTMNALAANAKAREQQLDRELLDSIPTLEVMGSVQRVAGPQVASLILSLSPKGQTALTQSLMDFATLSAANRLAGNTKASIADAYAKGVEGNQGPDYYNGLIKQWTTMADQVSKGDVPLDIVKSNVQYMFGPEAGNILAAMDDDSKFEYYKKVSSPTVTKQMIALRETGDTDSWDTYQQWTTNAFYSLFQQSVQDLQAVNTSSTMSGLSVRWDPTSKGFVIKSDGLFGIGGFEKPTANFNATLRTIAPIIEANGGDVEQELYGMMTQMGFDPSAERDDSLLGGMFSSLTSTLGGAANTWMANQQPGAVRRYGQGMFDQRTQ